MFGKRKTVEAIDRAGNTVEVLVAPVVETAQEKFGELTLDAGLAGLDRDLAKKAKKLLGYEALQDRITYKDRRMEALAKLHAIGVRPFNDAKVKTYMEDRRKEAQRGLDKYTGTVVRWTDTWLQGFSKQVPQHVLARAVEIKEKLPETQFLVASMEHVDRDPFLIARVDYHDFYIDVWDEPSFTGK